MGGRQAQLTSLARNTARGVSVPGNAHRIQQLQSIGALLSQVNPGVAPIFQNLITNAQEADSGRNVPILHNAPGKLSKGDKRIVGMAKQYLGTPYKWGGSQPGGFDCSGFVQYLYGRAGIKLGRTTYQQVKQGQHVGRQGLKAGDVIFFKKGTDVHHEALYMGNGKFIHAPHTGDVVKISSLNDPYYSSQFAGGRRFV
jgi:cell wall-associated NlpC family hydrolase